MIIKKKDSFILLIEDNKDVREALVWSLEYAGYRVVFAINGQEALNLLEKISLPFLIILDLTMPVLDGFQFREEKKLIPRIKNIPTIISSAKTNLEKIEKMPYESFLAKPFDLNKLLTIIKQYYSLIEENSCE